MIIETNTSRNTSHFHNLLYYIWNELKIDLLNCLIGDTACSSLETGPCLKHCV